MIQGCITPRWHHRQFKNLKLYSICRTRRRVPSDCGGVFSSRLLIISVPYARSGSLTLSNMCQTLFKRVKLFNTPTYELRKSSHVHNLAHGAECSAGVADSEPLSVTLDWTQESIYVRQGEGRQPYWSAQFLPEEERGGEGRNKMETLAPHYSVSYRRGVIQDLLQIDWDLFTRQQRQ